MTAYSVFKQKSDTVKVSLLSVFSFLFPVLAYAFSCPETESTDKRIHFLIAKQKCNIVCRHISIADVLQQIRALLLSGRIDFFVEFQYNKKCQNGNMLTRVNRNFEEDFIMNDLCMIIKEMVKPNFLNIRTSIQTYDRDAICCGAPCWRWAYHALHSADKWFINPCVYDEPPFHEEGLDNPDKPASVILFDEQLLDYLDSVEKKTFAYLDSLTDEMLYECPENCEHTRMELVLRQFRHISFHTGMLNGQTAVATGKFPMWVSQADKYVDDGIFFGRYRKGQVTK